RKKKLVLHCNTECAKIIHRQLSFMIEELAFELQFNTFSCKQSEVVFEDKIITVRSIPLKHRIPTSGFLFMEKPKLPNIKKEMVEKFSIPVADILKIKNGAGYTSSNGLYIPFDELTMPPSTPRSYAYCSDTSYDEKIIPLIRNVSLLYHEATFMHDLMEYADQTMHSTAKQAAILAKKAGVKKLLIGHYSSRYKNIYPLHKEAAVIFPQVISAADNLKIDID
ncbi:MAG: ribonuclease Z, partial [Bacteroidota bacterium]